MNQRKRHRKRCVEQRDPTQEKEAQKTASRAEGCYTRARSCDTIGRGTERSTERGKYERGIPNQRQYLGHKERGKQRGIVRSTERDK